MLDVLAVITPKAAGLRVRLGNFEDLLDSLALLQVPGSLHMQPERAGRRIAEGIASMI